MKRIALMLAAPLLILPGCASKGYLQKQIEPVACRVDVLETKNGALEEKFISLEARIAALETQVGGAQLANKAMLDEATAKAAESAQRAETAAASADQAAQRAEKLFELGQKK